MCCLVPGGEGGGLAAKTTVSGYGYIAYQINFTGNEMMDNIQENILPLQKTLAPARGVVKKDETIFSDFGYVAYEAKNNIHASILPMHTWMTTNCS